MCSRKRSGFIFPWHLILGTTFRREQLFAMSCTHIPKFSRTAGHKDISRVVQILESKYKPFAWTKLPHIDSRFWGLVFSPLEYKDFEETHHKVTRDVGHIIISRKICALWFYDRSLFALRIRVVDRRNERDAKKRINEPSVSLHLSHFYLRYILSGLPRYSVSNVPKSDLNQGRLELDSSC